MPNKNNDRPSDSFPASSFNRFNYGAPTMRREAPANFKAAIQEAAEDPENEGAKKLAPTLKRGVGSKSIRDIIKEDGAGYIAEQANSSNPDSYKNYKGPKPAPASKKAPTKRFCGGMSKPYKK